MDLKTNSLTYHIIRKADLPETPARHNDRYGQWAALARTIRLIGADQAIRLDLPDDMHAATAIRSLHTAARMMGVRVATMHVPPCLYIVRTGFAQPERRAVRIRGCCKYCQKEFAGNRPKQTTCGGDECTRQRKADNRRAWDLRRARLDSKGVRDAA